MNKAIKVLSVIAAIVIGLSFLLAIGFLTVLWEPIGIFYSDLDYIKETGPVLPLGDTVYLLCCLAAALFLLFTCNTKRNLAIEISLVVCFLIIFPIIRSFLSMQQSMLLSGFSEIKELTALTFTRNTLSLPLSLAELASGLCLINGGMRIADKFSVSNSMKN